MTDLYEAFLQRGPDGLGLSYWVNNVQVNGRAATLNGFKGSAEYRELAGTLYRETYWMVSDHLGTPRMVVDRSGSLAGVKRHDYFAFGEEVAGDAVGRTIARGYVGDSVRQKFTGYERDNETALDYAESRYYSPQMGRFTSPDEPLIDQWPHNPQSWNIYSYVGNNPLRFVDPSGYAVQDPNCPNGICPTSTPAVPEGAIPFVPMPELCRYHKQQQEQQQLRLDERQAHTHTIPCYRGQCHYGWRLVAHHCHITNGQVDICRAAGPGCARS